MANLRRVWPWAAAAGIALAAAGWTVAALAKPRLSDLKLGALNVTATRISSFDRFDGGRETFGKLVWRGGLTLTASSPAFGGFSGLVLTGKDGSRLIAVSDGGGWLSGTLSSKDGRPMALAGASMGPVPGLDGKPLKRDRDRDSEGISLAADGSHVLISFEQNMRIGRYALTEEGVGEAKGLLSLPKGVKQLRGNKGLESVAVLKGGAAPGAVVTFAERRQDPSGRQIGWLLPAGKAKAVDLRLTRTGAFDVTDLAALPGGGMIVLWRSFSWDDGVRMRLERVSAKQIAQAVTDGTPMTGELLFEADQRYEIDNMEGVAVTQNAAGETELTLISDDNFSWLQRTVLLRFVLEGEAQQQAALP